MAVFDPKRTLGAALAISLNHGSALVMPRVQEWMGDGTWPRLAQRGGLKIVRLMPIGARIHQSEPRDPIESRGSSLG